MRYRLDNYILWLIKCLGSVDELFSGLRWEAFHKMMNQNHGVLSINIILSILALQAFEVHK